MSAVVAVGGFAATVTDLLRLVVVPVLGWAAWTDVRTRRVPDRTWRPLLALGAVVLAWDGLVALQAGGRAWRLFLVPTLLSLGLVVPLAYAFWWYGGFGGADAKALMVLAVAMPTYPHFAVGSLELPLVVTTIRAFSFTVLTNAVLLGAAYPVALAGRNLLAGDVSRLSFVGRPVAVDRLPETHGSLLSGTENAGGRGLDLDALRMYLRWRGASLAAIRERPDEHRDPASLPASPNPPGDGAVGDRRAAGDVVAGASTDGGTESGDGAPGSIDGGTEDDGDPPADDPWGAEAFLADVEYDAYGTSPAALRAGLEAVVDRESVWVSPGIPFMVPLFLGLVVALTYGDVLFGLLRAFGVV